MKYSNLLLKKVIPIFIALYGVFYISDNVLKKLIDYLRSENLENLSYSIQRPKYFRNDLGFSSIAYYLEENDYYLYEQNFIEPDEVLKIRKKFPELERFYEKNKFSDIFEMTSFLLSKAEYDAEEKILNYIVSDYELFTSNFIDFERYIRNFYLRPAWNLIRVHQFSRAKWFINKAFDRILLDDTDPLRRLHTVDECMILKCILENQEYFDTHFKDGEQILDIFEYNNGYKIISKRNIDKIEITEKSKFYPISLYLKGVSLLKENKIEDAFTVFKKVNSVNKNNKFLKQLNMHLLARCLFWDCHNGKLKNKNIRIKQLTLILNKTKNSNLSTDIKHYIDFLKNPPKAYFNDTDNSIKDNSRDITKTIDKIKF